MLDGDFSSWWETGEEEVEVPIGAIVWWPSSAGAVPAGWALCDGIANAPGPDLRGRFLVGADGGHPDGGTGGGLTHTHAGHAAHGDHVGILAHDHDQRRHATTTGALSGLTTAPDMSSSSPAILGPKTGSTGAGASYVHDGHSAHDAPNGEPPWAAGDWIQRMS